MSANFTPKLIFLDSSPVQFRMYSQLLNEKYQIKGTAENTGSLDQLRALIGVLDKFILSDTDEIMKILQNTPPEERMGSLSQILLKSSKIETNEENINFFINEIIHKTLMVDHYFVDTHTKYNGDCLLIRAEDTMMKEFQQFEADYGLNGVFI